VNLTPAALDVDFPEIIDVLWQNKTKINKKHP